MPPRRIPILATTGANLTRVFEVCGVVQKLTEPLSHKFAKPNGTGTPVGLAQKTTLRFPHYEVHGWNETEWSLLWLFDLTSSCLSNAVEGKFSLFLSAKRPEKIHAVTMTTRTWFCPQSSSLWTLLQAPATSHLLGFRMWLAFQAIVVFWVSQSQWWLAGVFDFRSTNETAQRVSHQSVLNVSHACCHNWMWTDRCTFNSKHAGHWTFMIKSGVTHAKYWTSEIWCNWFSLPTKKGLQCLQCFATMCQDFNQYFIECWPNNCNFVLACFCFGQAKTATLYAVLLTLTLWVAALCSQRICSRKNFSSLSMSMPMTNFDKHPRLGSQFIHFLCQEVATFVIATFSSSNGNSA